MLNYIRQIYRNHLRRELERVPFAKRGKLVEIVPRCSFENPEKLSIGDYVYIGPGANFCAIGGLTIGENVSFSPNVTIHTSNHVYEGGEAIPYDHRSILKPVAIGSHAWIGAGVMINPGVTIGEGAVVAMGSVITRDVPPLAIVGGNPAQLIKMRDRDQFEKLKAAGRWRMREKHDPNAPPVQYLTQQEWEAIAASGDRRGNDHV